MKTIKTLLEIPAKYKWITVDRDGLVTLWARKPMLDLNQKMWVIKSVNTDLFTELYRTNPPKDWTKSIWRIEEYEEV